MSMESLDQCAWNGASCETDECSYYHDQASCPSSSYGSQCFWGWGPGGMDVMCSSIDPCSRNGANDEYMCGDNMDQCAWNGAVSCETDECSYYLDEASCPSSSYGSQCFWTYGSWSGRSASNDPCSRSATMSTCAEIIWISAHGAASCETDECSYYHDQASCPSSSYGSQCFWTYSSWSGMDICASNDPCSRSGFNDEYMCGERARGCTWNGARELRDRRMQLLPRSSLVPKLELRLAMLLDLWIMEWHGHLHFE